MPLDCWQIYFRLFLRDRVCVLTTSNLLGFSMKESSHGIFMRAAWFCL